MLADSRRVKELFVAALELTDEPARRCSRQICGASNK
jgi:hypothetical protein